MQTQPVDDIEAVLGRFQAWAGVRNAVETKAGIGSFPMRRLCGPGAIDGKA